MQRSRHQVANNDRPRSQHHRSKSRQSRRAERRGGELANSANSTQLVVYDPNNQHAERRGDVRRKKTDPIESRASSKRGRRRPRAHPDDVDPPKQRSAVVREGDVRKAYKVLPIVIGTGSFGTVRSCIHRESRTKLAIKSVAFKSHAGNAELLQNEIALLRSVNHENVVRVVDVIRDREYIHIVMEQCRGGDLFDMTVDDATRLSEGKVRKIVTCLLDAIAYLHDRDIVHRDLKAEHLMLASNDANSAIKIIDFGVATIHRPGDAPMTAFAGSARSVAPEVVKRRYGKECDLWSAGVITYFLLTQQMPFDGEDVREIFQKIVEGRFLYPQWAATGLSEEAKDFMDRLIVVDPRKRLTARQALTHPWIRGKMIRRANSTPQSKPKVSRSARSSRRTFHVPPQAKPDVSRRARSESRSRNLHTFHGHY